MLALIFGVLVGLTVAVILIMLVNIKCLEQLKEISDHLKGRKSESSWDDNESVSTE